MDVDLKLAIRKGIIILPVRESATVELRGNVLRYDPAIPSEDRCRRVLGALRTFSPHAT